MLEALLDAYRDLRQEAFCPGVHTSAHQRGKSRVNQGLPAYDRKYAEILFIARGLVNPIQVPALHSISGRQGSA